MAPGVGREADQGPTDRRDLKTEATDRPYASHQSEGSEGVCVCVKRRIHIWYVCCGRQGNISNSEDGVVVLLWTLPECIL